MVPMVSIVNAGFDGYTGLNGLFTSSNGSTTSNGINDLTGSPQSKSSFPIGKLGFPF